MAHVNYYTHPGSTCLWSQKPRLDLLVCVDAVIIIGRRLGLQSTIRTSFRDYCRHNLEWEFSSAPNRSHSEPAVPHRNPPARKKRQERKQRFHTAVHRREKNDKKESIVFFCFFRPMVSTVSSVLGWHRGDPVQGLPRLERGYTRGDLLYG